MSIHLCLETQFCRCSAVNVVRHGASSKEQLCPESSITISRHQQEGTSVKILSLLVIKNPATEFTAGPSVTIAIPNFITWVEWTNDRLPSLGMRIWSKDCCKIVVVIKFGRLCVRHREKRKQNLKDIRMLSLEAFWPNSLQRRTRRGHDCIQCLRFEFAPVTRREKYLWRGEETRSSKGIAPWSFSECQFQKSSYCIEDFWHEIYILSCLLLSTWCIKRVRNLLSKLCLSSCILFDFLIFWRFLHI